MITMGYDIVAYIDISQDAMEAIIKDGSFDKTNWDDKEKIANAYKKQFLPDFPDDIGWVYYNYKHNDDYDYYMHELCINYGGTNFIRDDPRLNDVRYIKMLEEKVGQELPFILKNINYCLRTSEDAEEIARGIRLFFPNDLEFNQFANWCEKTAKICSTYELSY